LLDAGLRAAGVPGAKFKTVCSSVDKLDKEPWGAVRAELVERKGISPAVADAVGAFVAQKGSLAGLVASLQASPLGTEDPAAAAALADLALLDAHLACLAVPPAAICLDMSLARGLDYYTGVIFEAVLEGPSAVGSIAAGGEKVGGGVTEREREREKKMRARAPFKPIIKAHVPSLSPFLFFYRSVRRPGWHVLRRGCPRRRRQHRH